MLLRILISLGALALGLGLAWVLSGPAIVHTQAWADPKRMAEATPGRTNRKMHSNPPTAPIDLTPAALDLAAPKEFETASLAMGCFWGPDALFGSLPGVLRTRVGYSGGTKVNPTYHDLGDHTETVEVDFDPGIVSYEDLLNVFYDNHDARQPAYSRQYRSAIFYRGEAQRETAEKVTAERTQAAGRLTTALEPFSSFTRAEDYHQKYYLTYDHTLMAELEQRYPTIEAFTDSTVVTRLEGLLGGLDLPASDFGAAQQSGGSAPAPGPDFSRYGLSERTTRYLESLAAQKRQVIACHSGSTPGGKAAH